MYKKNLLGLLVILLIFTRGVFADTIALNPNHPDKYVVVKGDTLWDISARFLKNPWQWPDIWHVNPQVKNPHLIYPGDILRLVYVDGKPRIILERGNVVKLSPTIRVTPIEEAIPTIPLDIIRPFLTEPHIVGKDDLDKAPYVVAHKGEHIIGATNDSIYVRGITGSDIRNYTVVRAGNVYTDPDTKEVLGYEAIFIGNSRLYRTGDPSTLLLTRTSREVEVGDRLMPSGKDIFNANFQPRAPRQTINGRILAVMDGVNQIGRNQIVVINKGARDGLEAGHVLSVYQAGNLIRDPVSKDRKAMVKLPDERAGTMMVFRTFDKLSYALIMTSVTNMNVLDFVRNP